MGVLAVLPDQHLVQLCPCTDAILPSSPPRRNGERAEKTLRALIEGGADLLSLDRQGFTPLHAMGKWQSAWPMYKIVIDALEERGQLAQALAVRNGFNDTVLHTVCQNQHVGKPMARRIRENALDYLLSKLTSFKQEKQLYHVNYSGENVLHVAAVRGDLDLVGGLLKKDPQGQLLRTGRILERTDGVVTSVLTPRLMVQQLPDNAVNKARILNLLKEVSAHFRGLVAWGREGGRQAVRQWSLGRSPFWRVIPRPTTCTSDPT